MTTYVLDTCVLLADPEAHTKFDEHDVVVPLCVIEELDRFKSGLDDVARNARHAIRALENYRAKSPNGLKEPFPMDHGGTIRIENNHVNTKLPSFLDPMKNDNRLLAVAKGLSGVLVTKDIALRIKADQLGVPTEDYRADVAIVSSPYEGVIDLEVEHEAVDQLHQDGKVELELSSEQRTEMGVGLNTCVALSGGQSHSGLGRVVQVQPDDGVVVHKVSGNHRPYNVQPRDQRQTFALDLLMDPTVPCVSVMGMAGTGKTFMALAAGLHQVMQGQYRRVSVYRPLVAVGKQEVGYLPGDLDEKLAPWMAAVMDNLYALLSRDDRKRDTQQVTQAIENMRDRGQLELAAITHLRGRSITDEFVIVDEAQNIELSALKVVLTRMASGSKVVFCGDLGQVDNPYVSPHGGMAAMIEKLKGTSLFGHVTLHKGVRSELAEFAAKAL